MRSANNWGIQEEESVELIDNGYGSRKRRKSLCIRKYGSKVVGTTVCLVLVVMTFICLFLTALFVFELAPVHKDTNYVPPTCNSNCRMSIVESIPENLTYSKDQTPHISTYQAWMNLLQVAESNLTISSFYWTLRGTKNVSDVTDDQGLHIFKAIEEAGSRGVKIRVVQNPPTSTFPNTDTKVLAQNGSIDVRSLNLTKLIGAGIIHTKMWIVDDQHFYIGSANMDWRSLTQVKELGILGTNCSCLAADAQKIFEIYWKAADNITKLPSNWSNDLRASFSLKTPAKLKVNGTSANVFFGSSPPELNAKNRTDDLDGLLNVINSANTFIDIAVMDYMPAMIYSYPRRYWGLIDDALRTAAYERGVQVRLLGSDWSQTRSDMIVFMKSLSALNNIGWHNGSIETKLFKVPDVQNKSIPFTRVNHNKYMVTDNAAYIGTSNWSGDYFVNTGGVSCVVNQSNSTYGGQQQQSSTIQAQLKAVFERDWNSPYSKNV